MTRTELIVGLILLVIAAIGIHVAIGTGDRKALASFALVGIVGAVLVMPKDYR